MAKNLTNIYFLLLLSLSQHNSIIINLRAARYNVAIDMDPNSKGAIFFNNEIGADYAKSVMENATFFIYKVFNQTEHSGGGRYEPKVITLRILNDLDHNLFGITLGDNINISCAKILGSSAYPQVANTSKNLFTSIVYHEMTHVYQNGIGLGAPSGLIEGIAGYVVVKSKFSQIERYRKLGSGSKWDEGSDVTEMFLEYCDGLKEGFTAKLNKKMSYGYNVSYFQDLLGGNVSQLWTEYKAMYGNVK